MIKLIEETHKYINTKTGEEYKSVSSILSKYKKPFDTVYWAAKKAKDYGTTPEEVTSKWDEVRDFSCARGKNYHKIMEDYIVTGLYNHDDKSLCDSFSKNLNLLGNARKIYAEQIVYNHDYKVAGTADVIIDHGNEFSIMDFKTNKRFRFYSTYGEYLLPPMDHMHCCEYNTYALQLSLYAYMYALNSGKKLRGMSINYLDVETETWQNIPIHFLKYEAHILLKLNK